MDWHVVVGTCRGLVCIAGPLLITEDEIWVKFWNPATRIVFERSPTLHRSANLTMDFGFGYDYKTEAYKVVALIANWLAEEDSKKARMKVFTIGDSCWRDMGIFPALPIAGTPTHKNDGVYINGTLNWLALCNFGDDNAWEVVDSVDQLIISSLDFGKETYKQFGVPAGLDELSEHMPVLGVLRDCLYLSHDYKTSHFVFWQTNEFGNAASWTQLFNVTYQHLQLDGFSLEQACHPLVPMCMSENGDVVVLLSKEDEAVILYDFKNDIVELYDIPGDEVWLNPKDYAESLVNKLLRKAYCLDAQLFYMRIL
ncbi:hypothetical protein PIB30_059109 [Stylosanthes scabra]|uniref:F-box associated beta-propeller type 1 domain-containing protein n=1 Tax=Stylosanthes scabra TaxID=79078 RepID=A0ABU6ZIX1_9FABA|nr:hypothetical protein [Stylosanthes scabra]